MSIRIDLDGYILAYKSVRKDYMDHHTGTISYAPGSLITMPRNQVSDDPDDGCSHGIHVGSYQYARKFHGGNNIVLVCRVDPSDVVSVPKDEHYGKMRTCCCYVIGLADTEQVHDDEEEDDDGYDPEDEYEDVDEEEEEEATDEEEAEAGPPEPEEEIADKVPEPAVESGLMSRKLEDLRLYARSLGIRNVGHIPGGKAGLVEKILAGRPEPEKTSTPRIRLDTRTDQTPVEGWEDFDKLSLLELSSRSLDDLRRYAVRILKMAGAGRLPGGKSSLIEAIAQKRRQAR
jgi:hypothetical protein